MKFLHNLNTNKSYYLLLIALIGFFIYLFYPILLHPNKFAFGSTGDGLKNYFTFTYYIQNNHSLSNFEGMNYPFGESVFYTDGHPLLAFLIKLISFIIPSISNYSVGILNLFLVFSLVLTIIYLVKIFNQYKIHPTFGLFGAFCILLMNPQLDRFFGHYALAYSCAIPMVFYYLIAFLERDKIIKYGIILILLCSLLFFTHAYLGIICSSLIALTAVFLFIKAIFTTKKYLQSAVLLLCGVIPVVLFFSTVKITDIHSGRTTNPWGIEENHSEIASVFLPYLSEDQLQKLPEFLTPSQPWEGRSYIGIGSIIVLIVLLTQFTYLKVKGKSESFFITKSIQFIFLSSFVLLLFSMFIPFRFGYNQLLENFETIKQFRAIGRFSWPFYYISTILLMLFSGKKLAENLETKNFYPAIIFGLILPFSLFFEGHDKFVSSSKALSKSSNLLAYQNLPTEISSAYSKINATNYQAILALPYFSFGSDNSGIGATYNSYKWSFVTAQHLKIPLLESYLTRVSIGESKKSMQLLASDFYRKEIQADLNSKKPFLVVYSHEKLTEKEYSLLKKCRLLFKGKSFDLLQLNYSDLFYNTSKKEWNNYQSIKNTLFNKNGFLVSDTNSFFQFEGFSKDCIPVLTAKRNYYRANPTGYNRIITLKNTDLQQNHTYQISGWMYNDGPNQGQDCIQGDFFIESIDGNGNRTWLPQHTFPTNSFEIYGDWTYFSIEFTHIDPTLSYDFMLLTNKKNGRHLRVDDLLMKDVNLMIYKELTNSILFKNNHRIEIK